ncbi:MAG: hypothetical protein AAF266_04170 [Planctomycetota bacterium]
MVSPWATVVRTGASRQAACLLPAALCLFVGCNSGRQLQTDLYQRELRLQEDEIYRLEDCIEEYQAIVRDYRCELAELKRANESVSTVSPTPTPEPLPEPAAADGPDMNVLPEVPEPLDLGPPASTDDMPRAGADPSGLDVAPAFDEAGEAPPFEGAQLGVEPTSSPVARLNEQPERTHLVTASVSRSTAERGATRPPDPYPHASATARLVPTSLPLSETIAIGVRNGPQQTLVVRIAERSSGWLAKFDGVASVMLTDPSVDGQLRRVARWDYTEGEVQDAISRSHDPNGKSEIVLTIALPPEVPVNEGLRLWARLVDASGNKSLQATTVRFLDNPLRLATAVEVASVLRRLPATDNRLRRHPAPAIPVVVKNDYPEGEEWRPARPTQERRIDPAIQTVGFEEVID